MATIPTPGSDVNTWGTELNEFLRIMHAEDGAVKKGSIFPDPAVVAQLFYRTDEQILYRFHGPASNDWKAVGKGTNHEDLTNLQGGAANDRLHLTAVEKGQLPSTDQKGALTGTDGVASATNKYVTNSDPRNTNSRTPILHAATHKGGGTDVIDNATPSVHGLMSATDKAKSDKLMIVGEPQYVDTITALTVMQDINSQTATIIGRVILDIDSHKRTGITPAYFLNLIAGRSSGTGTFEVDVFDITNSIVLASFTLRTDAVGTLFAKTALSGLPATGRIKAAVRALTSASATHVQVEAASIAVELAP